MGYFVPNLIYPDPCEFLHDVPGAIGPYCYSFTEGHLSTLVDIVIPAENLTQGPKRVNHSLMSIESILDDILEGDGSGNDSSVQHDWVSGSLTPFSGVMEKEFNRTEEYALYTRRVSGSYAVSARPGTDLTEIETVDAYAFGGWTKDRSMPGFWLNQHSYIDSNSLGPSFARWISAGGVSLRVTWGPDYGNQISLNSWRVIVPEDLHISNPNDVSLYVELEHAVDDEFFVDMGQYRSYSFIPTEPVVLIPDTEKYHAQVRARGSRVVFDFSSITMDATPADGCFYAVQKCVEAFHLVRVNGLSCFADIMKIKSFLVPLLKLLRRPSSLKNWSQVLLWWKYGVECSETDLTRIARGVKEISRIKSLREYRKIRESLQTRYGTFTEPFEYLREGLPFISGTHRSNARVVAWPVFPQWMDDLTLLLDDLGLRFNTVNLWDLIPYSFVVDWFVGVEDLLSQVDYLEEIKRLHLRELVKSAHNTAELAKYASYTDDFPFIGKLICETYDRDVIDTLPAPPMRPGAPSFLNHWWEGALIILSRKKE